MALGCKVEKGGIAQILENGRGDERREANVAHIRVTLKKTLALQF